MGRDQIKTRNRRFVLMARDPHCYWCRKRVRWFNAPSGKSLPPDFATIDHVTSRYGERSSIRDTVLACHECNQARADQEHAALGLWNIWKTSSMWPWYLKWLGFFYGFPTTRQKKRAREAQERRDKIRPRPLWKRIFR